jgi:hypothetical protein
VNADNRVRVLRETTPRLRVVGEDAVEQPGGGDVGGGRDHAAIIGQLGEKAMKND